MRYRHPAQNLTYRIDGCSRRPVFHLWPPGCSLVPPNSSRESAQKLTYPAHFLTCRLLSSSSKTQIWPLNLKQ